MSFTREEIIAVLDPLDDEGQVGQSDFDLNPDMRPAEWKILQQAAVLVPLIERPSGYTVLLTHERGASSTARQIAFPGGKLDPGETAAEAALRERTRVGLIRFRRPGRQGRSMKP